MGQSNDQQREELKKAYPNSRDWQEKCKNMPAEQVTAIYIRLKANGKLR